VIACVNLPAVSLLALLPSGSQQQSHAPGRKLCPSTTSASSVLATPHELAGPHVAEPRYAALRQDVAKHDARQRPHHTEVCRSVECCVRLVANMNHKQALWAAAGARGVLLMLWLPSSSVCQLQG
jgi:hypothetical protein